MKRHRKLTTRQRREVRAEQGTHVEVARKFGISPAYACMLRNGQRRLYFTPVEIMGAMLTSLAFTGAP